MDIFANCHGFVIHLAQGDFRNLGSYIIIMHIFGLKMFFDVTIWPLISNESKRELSQH